MKETYSPFDIAKICRVEVDTVLEWIASKQIPAFQIPGGHWRVRHPDLKGFLAAKAVSVSGDWEKEREKFKVLVVDDDPDLLEIVEELLREEPRFEVKLENNGFNAGLQIAGWHPDVILLDFVMPGVSGFEVCKKLRSRPETRDIPVIAFTSLSTFDNRKAVADSGVSDFLGKPFQSDMLLDKVRELLGLEKKPESKPAS